MSTLFDRVKRCKDLAERMHPVVVGVSPSLGEDMSEIAHHMGVILNVMGDSDYMFGRIDPEQPAPKRLSPDELLVQSMSGISPDVRAWAADVDIINLTDNQNVLIAAFMLFRHLGLRPPDKHRKVWCQQVAELVDAAGGDLVILRDGIKEAASSRMEGITIKGPKSVVGFVVNTRAKKDTMSSSRAVVVEA